MAFERGLTDLANPLQSPHGANSTHEEVQAALKDFAPKTRAQAAAVQKFLAEAGMIEETEEETQPQAVVTSTSLTSNLHAKEPDSESDDDSFERVPQLKNPWADVTEEESMKAWFVWEAEQGKQHLATPGNHWWHIMGSHKSQKSLLQS